MELQNQKVKMVMIKKRNQNKRLKKTKKKKKKKLKKNLKKKLRKNQQKVVKVTQIRQMIIYMDLLLKNMDFYQMISNLQDRLMISMLKQVQSLNIEFKENSHKKFKRKKTLDLIFNLWYKVSIQIKANLNLILMINIQTIEKERFII